MKTKLFFKHAFICVLIWPTVILAVAIIAACLLVIGSLWPLFYPFALGRYRKKVDANGQAPVNGEHAKAAHSKP